ncbi:unnamed protein product, partial [Gongylonema pulchrum]|uniref:SAM domain-containing protein n=1 Tax=Gongylonema pulchrum TaxID=637853 RepID=A0A183D8Y8_9BILA
MPGMPGTQGTHLLRRADGSAFVPGLLQDTNVQSQAGIAGSSRGDRVSTKTSRDHEIYLQELAAAVAARDETVQRVEAWTVQSDTEDKTAEFARKGGGGARPKEARRYKQDPRATHTIESPEIPEPSEEISLPSPSCEMMAQADFVLPVRDVKRMIAEYEMFIQSGVSRLTSESSRATYTRLSKPVPAARIEFEQIHPSLRWTAGSASRKAPGSPGTAVPAGGIEFAQIPESAAQQAGRTVTMPVLRPPSKPARSGTVQSVRVLKTGKTLQSSEVESTDIRESSEKAEHSGRTESVELPQSLRKTVDTGRTGYTRVLRPGKTMQSSEVESAQIPEPSERTGYSDRSEPEELPKSFRKTVDSGSAESERVFTSSKTLHLRESKSKKTLKPYERPIQPGRTESAELPKSQQKTVDTGRTGFTRDFISSKTLQSSEIESPQIPEPSEVRRHPGGTESAELPGTPRKTGQPDRSGFTQEDSSDKPTEPDEFEFAKILGSFKKAAHSSRTESMEISKSHRKTVGTGGAEFTRDFKPGKRLKPSEIESAQIPEPSEKATLSSKAESVEIPRSRWKTVDTSRTGFTRDFVSGKTLQSGEIESAQIPEPSEMRRHSGRTESAELPGAPRKTGQPGRSGFTQDGSSDKPTEPDE